MLVYKGEDEFVIYLPLCLNGYMYQTHYWGGSTFRSIK
jgi:hypothetical protein